MLRPFHPSQGDERNIDENDSVTSLDTVRRARDIAKTSNLQHSEDDLGQVIPIQIPGHADEDEHFDDIDADLDEGQQSHLDPHHEFAEARRVVEAVIFASKEPVSERQLADYISSTVRVSQVLKELQGDYKGRGFELTKCGKGWFFRTAEDMGPLLSKDVTEQRKLSRAALETLAIIAYHQPVSRPEIEDIRGVSLSRGTLDVIMELGWIKTAGRREVPGRPLLYATTQGFLQHFGLEKLNDLPGLDDLKSIGLLDDRPEMPGLFSYGEEGEELDD